MSELYSYEVKRADNRMESLETYKGRPLIIVNTASKCGLTPQFEGLQKLYEKYNEQGLEILVFTSGQFNDQEFHSQEETMEFCQKNYGVSFPMFAKIDVKGEQADPLFQYLISFPKDEAAQDVEWNFAKFLIDREGQLVKRYAPRTSPEEMEEDIQQLL